MFSVRARVRNGRLIVDEPTELPDGTEVELVCQEPTDAALEKLRRAAPAEEPLSPDESRELAEIAARGRFIPHDEVKRKVAAKKA